MCGYIGKISSKPTDNLTIEDNNKRIICRGPDETIKLKINFLIYLTTMMSFTLTLFLIG